MEATLRDAWENLGRVAGEYVHLDRIWDYDIDNPEAGRVTTDARDVLERLRDDGKPALLFTAPLLGNWELPAVAAQRHGLPTAVLYKMPNNRSVAAQIAAIRGPLMGRLISSRRAGAFGMAAALERGEHLGMLVDQFFGRGETITSRAGDQGEPDAGAAGEAGGLPGVRGAGDPPARAAVPHHHHRAAGVAARCRRGDRRARGDADDQRRGRGLGARGAGPVAVVPSAVEEIGAAPQRGGLPPRRPSASVPPTPDQEETHGMASEATLPRPPTALRSWRRSPTAAIA